MSIRYYEIVIRTAVANRNFHNDYEGVLEAEWEVTAYGDEITTLKEERLALPSALYKVMKLTNSKVHERVHLRLEEESRWIDRSETLWTEWRWTWLWE